MSIAAIGAGTVADDPTYDEAAATRHEAVLADLFSRNLAMD